MHTISTAELVEAVEQMPDGHTTLIVKPRLDRAPFGTRFDVAAARLVVSPVGGAFTVHKDTYGLTTPATS